MRAFSPHNQDDVTNKSYCWSRPIGQEPRMRLTTIMRVHRMLSLAFDVMFALSASTICLFRIGLGPLQVKKAPRLQSFAPQKAVVPAHYFWLQRIAIPTVAEKIVLRGEDAGRRTDKVDTQHTDCFLSRRLGHRSGPLPWLLQPQSAHGIPLAVFLGVPSGTRSRCL